MTSKEFFLNNPELLRRQRPSTEHRIPFQVDVIGEFHGAVVASKSAKEKQSNLRLLRFGVDS